MNGEAEFFNKIAENDYKVLDDEDYNKILEKHFPELLNNKMKILEIGCGAGAFGRHFKGDVKGIEISPKLSERANKFFTCLVGDIKNMPFENESFDIIFSGFVIHHLVQDIEVVIKEFRRVLKPNGKVFLIEPDKKSIFENFQRIRKGFYSKYYKQ